VKLPAHRAGLSRQDTGKPYVLYKASAHCLIHPAESTHKKIYKTGVTSISGMVETSLFNQAAWDCKDSCLNPQHDHS